MSYLRSQSSRVTGHVHPIPRWPGPRTSGSGRSSKGPPQGPTNQGAASALAWSSPPEPRRTSALREGGPLWRTQARAAHCRCEETRAQKGECPRPRSQSSGLSLLTMAAPCLVMGRLNGGKSSEQETRVPRIKDPELLPGESGGGLREGVRGERMSLLQKDRNGEHRFLGLHPPAGLI